MPPRTRNHFILKMIIESHLSLSSREPIANIGLGIGQRIFTFLPILHSQFLSLIPGSVDDHLKGRVFPLCLHWLGFLQILAGPSLPSSPYPFVSACNSKRYSIWETNGHTSLGVRQTTLIFLPFLHIQLLSLISSPLPVHLQEPIHDLCLHSLYTPQILMADKAFIPPVNSHSHSLRGDPHSCLTAPNTQKHILPDTQSVTTLMETQRYTLSNKNSMLLS